MTFGVLTVADRFFRFGEIIYEGANVPCNCHANQLQPLFFPILLWKRVAESTGLEPATSAVTGRRSNRLS